MKRIESIVVALDLTPASDAVLRRGLWLAQQPGVQRVVLVHALDARILDGIVSMGLSTRSEFEASTRAAAEVELARLAQRFREAGVAEVSVDCRLGRPDVELSAAVEAASPDLVIAGSGNRLWRQAMLGSTARRLLRLLHRPLWLVRGSGEHSYSRILLACDLSPSSARASEIAATYWPRLEFELVHVGEKLAELIAGMGAQPGIDPAEMQRRIEARSAERVEAFAKAHLGSIAPVTRLEQGHPVATLLRRSREWRPDLVVLGRSGHSGLQAKVLGSVTESLVDMLDCDLLVVPAG